MGKESQRVEQAQIVTQAALDGRQVATQLALFDASGNAIDLAGGLADQTGADVVLTGFVTGAAVTAVAATDTVNQAIAKLQNRITALENA